MVVTGITLWFLHCLLRVVLGLAKSHTETISSCLLFIFGRPLKTVLVCTPSHSGPPPSQHVAALLTMECQRRRRFFYPPVRWPVQSGVFILLAAPQSLHPK